MREEAKKADWYVAGGGKAVAASGGDGGAKGADGTGEAGGENAGALKTPKTPTSGRKRAAKSGAAEGTPSKSARKGKKGGEVEVKEEVMEDAI